jgi:hypothetical protein
MSKVILGMFEQLGAEVEAATGQDVYAQVMAGSEAISARTGGAEGALWTLGAGESRFKVMPRAQDVP